MAKQKKESNSILATIYLIILFATGITVGLTLQMSLTGKKQQTVAQYNTQSNKNIHKQQSKIFVEQKQNKNEQKPNQNQTVKEDVLKPENNPIVQKLENELVTVLVANNIVQQDIIVQYAKEIKDKKTEYTQYYKEIKLPKNKKFDTFDYQFKTLARNSKIELSKVIDENLGKVTYSFYDNNRIYSIVVFKKSEK